MANAACALLAQPAGDCVAENVDDDDEWEPRGKKKPPTSATSNGHTKPK